MQVNLAQSLVHRRMAVQALVQWFVEGYTFGQWSESSTRRSNNENSCESIPARA